MPPRQKGILFGLSAAAIWGGMYVVSKVVLEVIPPFALLSLRLLLGAAALGGWLAWRKGFPRLGRVQWAQMLAVGILGYGISLGFQFSGTKLSTAANGAVITAATPAFVYLFAWVWLGERVGGRRLLALLLSAVGVLMVVDPGQAQFNADPLLGNLLLVGAGSYLGAVFGASAARRAAHGHTLIHFRCIPGRPARRYSGRRLGTTY